MTKFAALILSHGRPDRVTTYRTLRRQGYTGPIYLLVDNEDKTLPEYQARYGDEVIVFDKADIAARFDEADNFGDRRAVFYARNASFEVAKQLGLETFLQLDDDYRTFYHKFDSLLRYRERPVKSLDRVFAAVLEFFDSIPASSVALGQNGDYLGGQHSSAGKVLRLKRKAMNSFFCSTERPFSFVGRVNEDVNTYVSAGNRGQLFFTVFNASISQEDTQQSKGGMSEMYKDSGTYWKSFYTVMFAPSCVHIQDMGHLHRRIHHRIEWSKAVPCIMAESWRRLE